MFALTNSKTIRSLILILGDQLDHESAAFDGFDPSQDAVWMAEVREEAEHVWSSKPRLVMFLSAMRHFAAALREKDIPVLYHGLDDGLSCPDFSTCLEQSIKCYKPQIVILTEPGDYRVRNQIETTLKRLDCPYDIRPDRHFLGSGNDFADHAADRKQLRMEFFYREMRKKHNILMDSAKKPAGGKWNLDAENRLPFGKDGPQKIPEQLSFPPDEITREVIRLVNERFGDHSGTTDRFDYPVTADQAAIALDDFIQYRLANFGPYQDAMWNGEPFLYHSLLSATLNLKLINPRKVIARAEGEFHEARAPLNSVEGFIRQILGWREYVRGVYWHYMPGYLDRNSLDATADLPGFYWTGNTEACCLQEVITQTLNYGYAHHIQRLMVTGLYALLLGVRPQKVHEWYLAVYIDAVEWVELPNTLGMSQYADGGIMASKPYAATGKYINRMSNYCQNCRYDPNKSTGPEACPFTTLYWDFLLRHQKRLADNPRMSLQLRNLGRLTKDDIKALQKQAGRLKSQ